MPAFVAERRPAAKGAGSHGVSACAWGSRGSSSGQCSGACCWFRDERTPAPRPSGLQELFTLIEPDQTRTVLCGNSLSRANLAQAIGKHSPLCALQIRFHATNGIIMPTIDRTALRMKKNRIPHETHNNCKKNKIAKCGGSNAAIAGTPFQIRKQLSGLAFIEKILLRKGFLKSTAE